jgi:hypothetical protein
VRENAGEISWDSSAEEGNTQELDMFRPVGYRLDICHGASCEIFAKFLEIKTKITPNIFRSAM